MRVRVSVCMGPWLCRWVCATVSFLINSHLFSSIFLFLFTEICLFYDVKIFVFVLIFIFFVRICEGACVCVCVWVWMCVLNICVCYFNTLSFRVKCINNKYIIIVVVIIIYCSCVWICVFECLRPSFSLMLTRSPSFSLFECVCVSLCVYFVQSK